MAINANSFQTMYQQPQGGNWFSNMSPEDKRALIGGGMTLLGGYLDQRNQNKQNTANNDAAMQRLELQLQMEREQRQRDLEQKQKELGLQAATQAPTRQNWRQQQAVLAGVLPQLRNYQVTPPGDLGRFMPQMSGGLRLPEGGLSPETMRFFSPEARMSAEQDMDRQAAIASGGNFAAPDYQGAGYNGASGAQAQIQSYADKIRQQQQQQALQNVSRIGAASPVEAQRQTQTSRQQAQNTGPSTGRRVANAAIGAGLGYLSARYGGNSNANPWASAALGGFGGFMG